MMTDTFNIIQESMKILEPDDFEPSETFQDISFSRELVLPTPLKDLITFTNDINEIILQPFSNEPTYKNDELIEKLIEKPPENQTLLKCMQTNETLLPEFTLPTVITTKVHKTRHSKHVPKFKRKKRKISEGIENGTENENYLPLPYENLPWVFSPQLAPRLEHNVSIEQHLATMEMNMTRMIKEKERMLINQTYQETQIKEMSKQLSLQSESLKKARKTSTETTRQLQAWKAWADAYELQQRDINKHNELKDRYMDQMERRILILPTEEKITLTKKSDMTLFIKSINYIKQTIREKDYQLHSSNTPVLLSLINTPLSK